MVRQAQKGKRLGQATLLQFSVFYHFHEVNKFTGHKYVKTPSLYLNHHVLAWV